LAFGVTGFAALRLEPQPQVFQALSIGARNPVPPSPPYGTPNQNLVPVSKTGNPSVPANLTLAAQPVFAAILHVNNTIVAAGSPSVNGAPNTTSSVGANNPSVNVQVQGPGTPNGQANVAQGPVSFSLTVAPNYVTSGEQVVAQTPQVQVPSAPKAAPNAPLPSLDHELQKALAANAPAPQSGPSSAPSLPPSSSPQYVLPSNGASVAKIVATVNQLAVSAVYPAPIFSFAA
jgi:hypothetical protein